MIWLLAAAALTGQPAQDDAQTTLQELQQVFQESCGQRGYGAYDDVCNQLKQQLHQAEVAADREAREAKRKGRKPADPPPPAKPDASPPPPSPSPPTAPPEPLGYKPPPHPQA